MEERSQRRTNDKYEQQSGQQARRLEAAENNMRAMLDRVEQEKLSVEAAVRDLEQANETVERDAFYQLRQGGIPKQVALVGCVLFAGRSLTDTFTAVSGNDEAVLVSAVVQGLIALAFAIAFVVI